MISLKTIRLNVGKIYFNISHKLCLVTSKYKLSGKIGMTLLFMFLLIQAGHAATITTTGSGNWSSTTANAPWPGGTIPATGDNIVIGNGFTLTVNGNRTCNSILFSTSVSGTATGTLSVNNGVVLTVTTSVTAPGDKQSGNYAISGAGTINCASLICNNTTLPGGSAGTTITITSTITALSISGNLTLNSTHTSSGTKANNPVFDLQSGTVTVQGTVAFVFGANSNATDNTSVFTTANGAQTGTLILSGATPLSSSGTGNRVTTLNGTGATVKYSRSGSQTVVATPYSNLTLAGSNAKTTTGVTVNGILSMEGTATASVAPTYGAAATLQYNTATARTAGVEWITPFVATGGVVVKSTGTITLNAAKVLGNNTNVPLNINMSATLATANFGLTFHGDFINSGTFTAGSSPITITGTTSSQNIGGYTTTGLTTMSKTGGTATYTGTVNGAGLTINGSGGTLNLGTSLTHTFTGNITLTAGTLNGGSSTLNANSTSVTAWTGTGSNFSAGTGTVVFGGVAQTINTATTFNNVTMGGSGTKTMAAALTANGNLTINSSVTLATANLLLTLGGNFTNNGIFTAGSSAITLTGSAAQTISGYTTTGLTTMSKSAGTATFSGNVNGAGLTIDGAGGTLDLGNSLTHTFTGDVTLTSGTLNGGSSTLNVNSTAATAWTGTGSNFTAATGTVSFGGVAQTIATATTFNNLTLSNSGSKTFSATTTIGGVFSIATGVTANLGTGLTHTANSLQLAGVGKSNGTWGGTGSSAVFVNTTFFDASSGIVTVTIASCSDGSWIGYTDTNWGTASNWCGGSVPTSSTNVVIPSGGNQPVISSAATCNNLTISSGATLQISGSNTLTINGDLVNSGTFTPGSSSTVILNGGIETISGNAVTFNNLTINSTGVKTFSTIPTVNGILSMQGTATVSAAPTYGSAATLQYNTSTDRTAGIEWISPFVASNGVVISNLGNITMNGIKVFNASVPLTINASSSLTTNNYELDLGGNFINSGTITAGSSPIVITNNMAVQSISGFSTTGLVSMTKSSGTATFTDAVNGAGLTINGGGTLNLGSYTHTFTGDLSLASGTLNAASAILNIGGDGTTGGTFTPGNSTVNYYASAPQTIASLTYNNLTLSGSSAKTTTSITVNGLLSMEGTATASAVPTYGSSATLQYKGSGAQTSGPEFPASWAGSGGVLIENASGVTLNAAKNINANPFTIGGTINGSIFNDGGFVLTSTGTLNLNSGTYSISSAAFPSFSGGITIASGTTVEYAAAATQTIKGLTYSNLTISGAGANSKTADADVTVNGILNLNSSNASATQGCLSMGAYILSMGASATTAGTGDVTGIVKRTSFVASTTYSFGNPYTTITFTAGTLPSVIQVKNAMGAAPTWKTGAIQRIYEVIRTGGDATSYATLNLHYLTSELNSNTEANLVKYGWELSDGSVAEVGRTAFDLTNHWSGQSNFQVSIWHETTSFGDRQLTLANASTTNTKTWYGLTSTDWSNQFNWTPNGVPDNTNDVIIPDASTTNYDPTIGVAATVKTLTIQSGGVLNGGSNTLTIAGGAGAWINSGGSSAFSPGTGTVIFTNPAASLSGSTSFSNLTIDGATAILSIGSGTTTKISGTLSLVNGGKLAANDNTNTIEYNGSAQTVINPNGTTPGYSSLILSGSGIKTMPASSLTINGDFTMSGTASATAADVLTIAGNVNLGSGTTLNASSFTHAVKGDWTNNGGTFTSGTSTINFNNTAAAQSINGTAASQNFNNLVVNKSAQTLSTGGSITSLTVNNLTETSGNFTAPATLTINGNALLTAGTFTAGTTTTLLGNLTNNGATLSPGSSTFNFTGSSAQTIGGTGSNTFNNLTINNAAGVSAGTDQTVNGVLNLQSANPSPTQGALEMGSNTLLMGANATNTGTGDVTGIVNRTSFTTNTSYTFGNQFTNLTMLAGGVLPTSVSFKIVLSNSWKTTGIIDRYYDIIQSGGNSATFATLSLHYLTGELNGSTEGMMDLFDHDISPVFTEDQGSSNYDLTDKWVSLANLSLTYIAPSAYDVKYWTLGTTTNGNNCTWSALANSTNWNDAGNWTGGVPVATSNVYIPSGKSYYPILPANTTINSMSIQSGGTVTGGTGTILTIAGAAGAWDNAGTFVPGTSTVIFTNAAATMADPTNFYNVTIADGASLTLGLNNIMRIAGTLSTSTSGVLDAASNHNTVEYNGADQMILLPNGTTAGYHNLILSGSGTKTLPSSLLDIYGDFTLSGTASANASQDIHLAGNWINNGSGSFIGGTYSVIFNGSASQTISGINTFNDLTIYKTSSGKGVSASADQTVNGVLYLNSPNHSSTVGALDLGANTLNMGASATTTGTGDVTGTITRTDISPSITYTFGNPNSSISFQNTGTLPTAISVTTSLGTAPAWKTDAILRTYTMTKTGGSGAKATLQIHYLDSELNSTTESLLVPWTYYSSTTTENARSNYNTTNNYISISNVDFSFPSGTVFTLGNSATAYYTWTGATSTDWNTPTNWSSAIVPIASSNVIIPDAGTTTFDPSLPSTTEISTISIQNGGILNAVTGAQLTLNGSSGTWINSGVFNPNNSTVIFTNANATQAGATNYYNLTINAGTRLALASGSVIGIAGTVTNLGAWSVVSQGPTTVNYNGGNQTVVVPDSTTNRYSTLILSGTGTKTMPATALTMNADLSISGSTTVNAGNTLTVAGQFTLTSGTFIAGSYTHNIKGDWTKNGGTFTSTGSTFNFNGTGVQTIGGTSSSAFNVLTINNTAGVALGCVTTVNTLTIGNITTSSLFSDNGFQLTSTGTLNLTSGTFKLGATTATSYPAFSTNNIGEGTIEYAATATQTVKGMTYTNLIISGTGANSKIADGDITVNDLLNLSSSNASSTQGCLHMGAYTLTMSEPAVTTGTGDVTGIVKRSVVVLFKDYSFGNQHTTMNFTIGPLTQSEVSVKISLTGAGGVSWKSDAINRNYDIKSPSADAATRLALNLHYLGSELNGNVESNLDLWDDHVGTAIHDHGRSYASIPNGTVGFSNVGLKFMSGDDFGQRYWTLSTSIYGSTTTWIGGSPSGPTDWMLPGNWQGGVPISTSNVVIPGGLTYYPVLPGGSQTINTLQIQSGAVLNTSGIPVLTVAGATDAIQNSGTFNPGNSTVLFTNAAATLSGSINFNHLTVANGASVTAGAGDTIGIAGTLTLTGTGTLDVSGTGTTTDFNGVDQTVVVPGTGFYNLKLSGSGTKTMPSTALSVQNFTTSGTATIVMANTLAVAGDLALGSGSNLDMVTFALSLTGSVSGTGTLSTQKTGVNPIPSGKTWTGTIVMNGNSAQTLVSGTYNNLTINNAGGVTLNGTDATINGFLILTNGVLTTGANTIIVGNTASNAIVGGSSSNYVDGNLLRGILSGTNTYAFPVGTSSGYSPVSLALTSVSTGGTLTVSSNNGVSSNYSPSLNGTKQLARYWTISDSGIGTFTSNATFTYLSGDLSGGALAGNLLAYNYTTGPLYTYPSTSTGTLSFTANGLSSFGELGAGECNAPTITLGSNPSVCSGTTSAAISYSATTVSPDKYNITYDATALSAGFLNVSNASLPSSPITMIVPAYATAGTYHATLTVKNSATGCVSSGYSITVTVNANPVALVLTGSTICTSPGGNGTITSSTSVSGVNYQLFTTANAVVGSAVAGTGSALSWGSLPSGTGYYVVATNATTSCVSSSSNAVNVATYANPAALVLTGSIICASPGGNGTITSSTSVSGVNYQLFTAANAVVGSAVAGTG
jgi:hypothetical protein